METKEYSLKISNESKLILITGITSNAISIDFSGDIDFTKLVSELTQSIDSKKLLIPKGDNDISEESTLKLILETIDSIIKEYNKTVATLDKTVDDVEDSEPEAVIEPEIDNDANLPF
ncbi:MAG: hypothetical protein HN778_17950 [Prolixibacteraceae bacterium]|jgi:hypothetical protein|nr:hypothetical protein [Prolixibacteraceae bacterium]MBT6005316.1 hypothetical protein [Prolixibacteraceae bacterium]MBT6763674.1 hypothetical protein [Prolixibacteraceae bacterium]MBT6997227.1 hypothetical protein [Prolixibacteraceae bacterium]MBT7396716.1 hypothetical protein [Prolixibacteraceae bacterium]